MSLLRSLLCAALAMLPGRAAAADPPASAHDERALWAHTERLALGWEASSEQTLRGMQRIQADSGPIDSAGPVALRFGDDLYASRADIEHGPDGRILSLRFPLAGRCVPLRSLRQRHPQLWVMDYPRGHGPGGDTTLGAEVGPTVK